MQRNVAYALAQNETGIGRLLDAVTAGKASPRLLQDQRVTDLLNRNGSDQQKESVAELIKGLPAPNEQIDKLITHHCATFLQTATETSATNGHVVFAKSCAACHRIGSEGSMVGPQLDGVGNRGLDRLLEDILDPNRNVDVAFRMVTIETDDGKVVSGLPRRREGETIVLADQTGKEFRLPVAKIQEQRPSRVSLMPANVSETLTEQQLHDLLAFLLTQRTGVGDPETK